MVRRKNLKIPNSNSKVGIIGYGEVGQAISKLYKNPKIKDLNQDDGLEGIDILNICIPWNKNFIKEIKKEIKSLRPELIIIHSTVAPGTTKKLALEFNGMVVHSPVRGMHPNLYKGIKTFVKYIGAENKKAGEKAKKHLRELGIRTKVFYPSITTEIGKLLDTTYYGLCIAWHGEMAKICNKFGVDFKKAVTEFNETYNEGYVKLNRKNVVRPILYPPKESIGGHCIIPNAKILKEYFRSKVIDLVLEYSSRSRNKNYLRKSKINKIVQK